MVGPLRTRAFVGRELELQQLVAALEAAVAGRGSVAAIAGEPGIGKTALCEALVAFAVERGGRAYFGHSYEETSLSLPYQPFVEAIRGYIVTSNLELLREELGFGAPALARIIPELRDRLRVDLKTAVDPAEARWRLLQAITDFLKGIAAKTPLIIVLEDMHWADRGTLDLLQHLARNVAEARLLIVCTYRDGEADRSDALLSALAELSRMAGFFHIALRGLNVEEVHSLSKAVRGGKISRRQAEYVHREAEGNPLFVLELLRLLEQHPDSWVSGHQSVSAQVPEGLRNVIANRFVRLGDATTSLLAVAAVLGHEFRLDVLEKVAVLADEDLIEALEDAVRAGVLEEWPGTGAIRYRFTHALYRQSLYEGISAPRRSRLHQQAGRALQQVGAWSEDNAGQISEHLAQSHDPADLAKSIVFGEMAARRALSAFAGEEAARHIERGLALLEITAPEDDARKFELIMSLGEALTMTGSARRILDEVAPAALGLAKALGDRDRCSGACQLALNAISLFGAGPAYATSEAKRWATLAERFAGDGTAARVRADITHALMSLDGEGKTAREMAQRALQLARRIGDATAVWAAEACTQLVASYAPSARSHAAALEFTDRLVALPDVPYAGGDRDRERAYYFGADAYLKAGRRDEFEAILLTFEADVARRRSPTGHILAASLRSWLAYADGRLEEWLTIDREMAEFADEQGIATFARIFRSLNVARGAYYLGDLPPEFGIRCGHGMVTASQFQGNNKDAVAFLDASLSSCTADSEWEFWNYTIVGELAFRVRHEEAARLVLQRLQDLPLEVSGHSWSICVSRLRGDCFAVIGQPETASANYEEALRVCSRLGFRPELALTHLNYAELLAEHYPDKLGAAAEYLDVALGELRELKMKPALNRALILREALEAGRPTAGNQPDHLTRREADVLALVAEGLSNKQIAEYLVLSVRTVERHLTNSYRKIGAHSKAQATAYALSKGLHSISSGSGKTT